MKIIDRAERLKKAIEKNKMELKQIQRDCLHKRVVKKKYKGNNGGQGGLTDCLDCGKCLYWWTEPLIGKVKTTSRVVSYPDGYEERGQP